MPSTHPSQSGKILRVFKWMFSMLLKIFISIAVLGILLLAGSRLVTGIYARSRIYSASAVPAHRVAIVFGAGLWRDGNPTPVLVDRVTTAVNLYFAGKVEKLLFSGDNRFIDYNEPEAMRQLAISMGVPSDAIVRDYAGRRTYDTCYRARVIFAVDEAILVTQSFHMPRALYTCSHLGIKSIGVVSDNRIYRKSSVLYWNMRELPATLAAFWDLHLSHPLPVLGSQEPIFP